MSEERLGPWALILAIPLCCGGFAAFGAGTFAFLGAIALWQGALAFAVVAIIAAIAFIIIRRRRTCEP